MAEADLFPDDDYRFRMGLRRGDARDFFSPRDPTGAVLAERARWLKTDGGRYAALLPEGRPLLAEFANLITGNSLVQPTSPAAIDPKILGAALEPDFLLLSYDKPGGAARPETLPLILRGGALCFPTGWALEAKIGHPVDFIHGVVPGLNPALGRQIDQFFAKLTPGTSFTRANWGIAATSELNMHPSLNRPAPTPPVSLDRLWLRVEHQIFTGLPVPHARDSAKAGGIVFGIRIALHSLADLSRDRPLASGLARALRTMSPAVAAYKRLESIRDELQSKLN